MRNHFLSTCVAIALLLYLIQAGYFAANIVLYLAIWACCMLGRSGPAMAMSVASIVGPNFTAQSEVAQSIALIAPQTAYVGGWIGRIILDRKWRFSVHNYSLILLLLPVIALASTLFSGFHAYFHLYALYSINILYSLVLAIDLQHSQTKLRWISMGFALTGLIAVLVAMGESDGAGRLSIDGNVRLVANALGGAILLILLNRLVPHFVGKVDRVHSRNPLVLVVVALMFSALVATASRGVLIAVGGGLGAALLSNLVTFAPGRMPSRARKAVANPKAVGSFLAIGGILAAGALLVQYLGDRSTIAARWDMSFSEDGRLRIWENAVNSLEAQDMLLGAGINRFPSLASDNFGMYAHSVFMDHFVSFGVVGLATLIMPMLLHIYSALRGKRPFGLGVWAYLILSYSLHGSITSGSFWIIWAVAAASSGDYRSMLRIPSVGRATKRIDRHCDLRSQGW